ncbi:PASTA domain-containing protein [Gryllotalpicola reticulitermitis]|uniref:PASTA domain-containing protein n=1 Tax=Gryllotalpicola reticulitermitis TaxID=1184153 RepID=A0ABV8Q556_9MICO
MLLLAAALVAAGGPLSFAVHRPTPATATALVAVPDTHGLTPVAAADIRARAGLDVAADTQSPSPAVPDGKVIGTAPAATARDAP